jgi:DNA-binding NarL/FixJ family response regulator
MTVTPQAPAPRAEKTVVIIEDQRAVREMVAQVVVGAGSFRLVGQTGDGSSAWQLCLDQSPDLVILDIMLPGMNGGDVLRRFARERKDTRILVFSAHCTASAVRSLLEAGAHGFVEKTAPLSELRRGIEVVASGGTYFSSDVSSIVRDALVNPLVPGRERSVDALTAREKEVLRNIALSFSTKEIAVRLGISPKTAENHRTNLMKKLELHDVAALTRYAITEGLVDLTEAER